MDAIVENCGKIFNINDLMECGFISSLHIAIIVLEVFNEVFEDIVIDDGLYELSVVSRSVYQFLSFRSLPFRLSPSPFPPETPDTQATTNRESY